MKHVDMALNLFESKFNCAQAVFASFSHELNLSKEQALKIGACFGSGMRKGEVCGACTGALMVIGLKYGQFEIGDIESKSKSDELCVKFLEEFKHQNGSYLCNDLLNCDITTQEGVNQALDNNLFVELCPKRVESSVRILENILKE